MPPVTFQVGAVLFDMDGTLVNSTAGVIGAWETFAKSYPGLDLETILKGAHGVRTVENLERHCGITDKAELEKEAARFEQAIVDCSRDNGRSGITLLPGVRAIIDELLPAKSSPSARWAICTSATRAYASAALEVANIETPEVFVTAEDVEKGKPSPDPYLMGAGKCGVSPSRCVVVEDAPAGVRSGKAAGCKVIALLTSHSRQQMEVTGPDFLVQDFVSMRLNEGGVEVTVHS
ncbi:HAD-like domain-containing protein [Phlebopus sp. FC_14]|nr:HAD-like domain-containing protein [Phlebopus sp. FC_14]